MLLAVDCGNSNTVFSVWDGSNFIATWRISTHWQRTADQYFVWLSSLMKLNKLEVEINDKKFKCIVVEKPFFDPKKKITSTSI